MMNLSARAWLLMGFGLSLLSVVTNIFVLAGINDRIKETDAELTKLNESLRTQAADVDRADLKYDLFTILNHVSKLGKSEANQLAGEDSLIMLQDFLTIYYSAVNEVPANEVLRTESEQAAAFIPAVEKIKEAEQQTKLGNKAEAEKSIDEARQILANYTPKTELGRKLQEILKFTEADGMVEMNTDQISMELAPRIKSSIDQYLDNYQKKEERIKALQEKKSNLSWQANLATYAAVSLQLFGLMFVLTKDLTSDTKSRREKAAEEASQETDKSEDSLVEPEEEIKIVADNNAKKK